MKLSELVGPELFVPPEWDREVKHLLVDSRDVAAGDVFIARQGSSGHGQDYVQAAIKQGAVAVIVEQGAAFQCIDGVPVFGIGHLQALPEWLQRRYPEVQQVDLIGVTGTNGKSSVSHYIAQLSTLLHKPCAVLGTLGNGVWPDLVASRNTTADLSVIMRGLAELSHSASLAAMEVSSHGLDQGRVAGLSFDVAIMTNLTQDHLDYHGDMQSYFQAKQRLFTDYAVNTAVICVDDDYGRRLADSPLAANKVVTVGRSGADVCFEILPRDSGMAAMVRSPWGDAELWLPLAGDFNVSNALLAMVALASRGYDWRQLVHAARQLQPVSGRMERYRDAAGREAIIDFAHTPEALVTVLNASRGQFKRLLLVFGCGGDRDRSKRAPMARAAATGADQVWLTDDNPRFEDPQQIFADVLQEPAAQPFIQQHDRRAAITAAIAELEQGDGVIIAGKGHEPYQDICGEKRPYSDAEVLAELGFKPVAEVTDVS